MRQPAADRRESTLRRARPAAASATRPIPTLESLLELVAGRVPLLLEVKVDGDIWRWVPALQRRAARTIAGRSA